jgi:hypothetical protein
MADEGIAEPARTTWSYEARTEDPYWQAAMDAWRRIAAHPYLPGTMRWLERTRPSLYRRLVEEFPAQIDRLWDARAPLERFQGVLDRWVEAHREGCQLYQVSVRNSKD